MKNRARIAILLAGCFLVAGLLLASYNPDGTVAAWTRSALIKEMIDHEVGHYTTILDEEGNLVTKTSRSVYAGDEVITRHGKHFKVFRVDNDVAQAKLLGMDRDLLAYNEYFRNYELPAVTGAPQQDQQRRVAVYHSHGMESYVPTEGSAFQTNGGIIQVGAAFADRLRNNQVTAVHNQTTHGPHDAQAYVRSRKTAVQLLQENPIALFDVHRDGVPDAEFYRQEAPQQGTSQIRLVIGRQNPKRDANMDLARRLMSYANQQNPGLVKEIFMARGNYNQDLISTALLFEVGTHTVTRQEAENGIALLADAVPVVLGIGAGAGAADQVRPAAGAAGWRTVLIIAVVTLIGAAAFVIVSAGGLPQAKEKVREFFTKEFNLFGQKVRVDGSRRRNDEDNQ
ncbi:MAG: stage II sporulation protein P [Eubacteriales bacterium]|nr:stage II sporulation protein P [Eubacteriales bacterium]MDZ7609805.1 stage II sporulation protein P [Eubacteriales bacterium]